VRSLKLNMLIMRASIAKAKLISVGLSVCRVNAGEIVFSAHQGEQRILFEVSDAECTNFVEKLNALLSENKEGLTPVPAQGPLCP